jgi:oxygen-independent coproporphyrinogen III oxidase
MQSTWLKYLDRRIPRYTSYPTAVQFGPDIDAGRYQHWLATLPPDAAVSIYIHVPFCTALCLYCGCHTTVVRRYAPVADYVDLLQREIGAIGSVVGRRTVTQVHWGGGTPTVLSTDDFMRVMSALRTSFLIAPQAELAVEIDPRVLSREYVATLAAAGITRASLGAQDFDARVQRAVGRIQSFDQTALAADWLRDVGIANINIDLMYGLPYQRVTTVAATAQRAMALAPDRIALFGYAHVPAMKRHQKLIPEQALPDSLQRAAQNSAAAGIFVEAGYQRIGLDHFARSDDVLVARQRECRLHRNFQGYTADETPILLGFGTSAISSLPQGYAQNAASVITYRNALASDRLATARGRARTDEDRLRGFIIERLMCDLHVDLGKACQAHGAPVNHFAAELSQIDELANDGIVVRSGERVTIPESARPLVRTVCAIFDAYLADGEAHFSRAS